MSSPLVTIIVPIYNAELYLEECISSLLNQDYSNLEILAVNDGSTDCSQKILVNFAAHDSRLHVIHSINQGVSAARNRALEQARGEYIVFVDSDDWLDLTTISQCVQRMQGYAADVCLFAYMREFSNLSTPRYLFDSDRIFDSDECKDLQRRMVGPIGVELRNPGMLDSYGTIWGKIYRKEVIKDIKFVDLKIIGTAEDTLFNCMAFLNVQKAIYVNQPFYHYRKFNSASETKKYKPNLYLQWNKLFEYIQKTVWSQEAEQALNNRIALSTLGLGLNESASASSLKIKKNRIKTIINQSHYLEAYQKLDFGYFPLHWKIFFFCVRYKSYYLYLLLTSCINFMLRHK